MEETTFVFFRAVDPKPVLGVSVFHLEECMRSSRSPQVLNIYWVLPICLAVLGTEDTAESPTLMNLHNCGMTEDKAQKENILSDGNQSNA